MIWQDRTRTDPTKRKFIDENGNEQNVNIEEIQSNITQSGTPVNATTMNNIEKNLGTYGNDTYDSTATYLEGETVTHNALLYRAKQDIETPEEWTAEHWEETSALGELSRTSGNEIAYGLDNITRQSKAVVYPTNYRTVNQEVNIGATNPSNTRTWFKKSKNLFDKNSMVLNASINAASSQLSSSNDYRTIFIKCKPNTIYKYSQSVSSNRYTVGYTSDTNLTLPKKLTNVSASHTFTTASDTQYIFIMVSNITTDTSNINDILNSAMLNEGETALPYEPYINSSINIDNKPFTETVNVGAEQNNSRVWFKQGKNLINCSGIITSPSTNVIVTPSFSNGQLDYINVTKNASTTTNVFITLTQFTFNLETETYYLSGCPSGGGDSTYSLYFRDNTTNTDVSPRDIGSGASVSLTNGHNYTLYLRIAAASTFTDKKFYPMLTNTSVTDTAYEPYVQKAININGKDEYYTNDYSTIEQVIGTFFGKPLYRKVITGSSTNVDTLFNIDHNISNPEMYRITGDSFIRIGASSFPVNYPSGNTTNLDKRIIYSVMNATKIQLYVGSYLQSSGYDYCFVVEYTKTTD